jgi:DNA-damage-inducible protein D
MGSEELAASLFRATQAEAKITREGITAKEAANRAHHDVGAAVRSFIIDTLGGTPPEHLPTPIESITQAQARERRAVEQERISERQPSLFEPTLKQLDEPREP